MQKILGIDTGGTYTDGVIVRADTKEVLAKAKTLTTRGNLHLCINNCIHAFSPEELAGVSLVCLSTTLATNAVVEGRGCAEGLILIGSRPQGVLPTERYRIVRGRPDIHGRMRENIDVQEIDEAIESMRGQVEAIAVSGYASVRNPEHEIYVKERIQKLLDIPVVCAHDLTASLGFYERTVTATLNARLIPMICELIDSVGQVMQGHGITAPLMIVKGDGTLMTDECAKDKPIETILSGPAASVIGGVFLSGETDAMILDMGGTTTDLANVTNGNVRMSGNGAAVGGWFTRIRAAEIFTIGLGGDSRIWLDGERRIQVGPTKVIPYCIACKWFPALLREVTAIYRLESKPHLRFVRGEAEAYMISRYTAAADCAGAEGDILKALEHTPHTLYWLQKHCEIPGLSPALERLLKRGSISRIALTPTDLLHAEGVYHHWDPAASTLCLTLLAEQLGVTPEECMRRVRQVIYRRINCACIQSSFFHDQQDGMPESPATSYFVERLFLDDQSPILGAHYYLKKPVVAIGAPARAWVDDIARTLGTRVVVPENAEVANAVGAAVGQALEQAELLIRPDPLTKTYTLFSSLHRKNFDSLDAATAEARALGAQLATACLPGTDFDVTDQVDDVYVDNRFTGNRRFIERRVRVTAVSHIDESQLAAE